MIESYKIPPEQLKDVYDLEGALIGLAMKVNEVVEEINKLEGESSFEEALYALIDTWKKEAIELESHPENFHSFNREVCIAIARDKMHCCTELIKLIQEYQ